MSRNSIRLIKGQNRIELIYRVNSESLKMKKKVWTWLLLKHKLLVNRRGALFTFQWESVTKMTRWRGSYWNAPVVSMINIFLSAPFTTLPLNTNYFTGVISQIQSFHSVTWWREDWEPCCCDALQASKPHRDPYFLFWLQTCSILQEVVARCVASDNPIRSSCLRTPSAISRSTRGEEVRYSLYQEFNLWRMFFMMCHYFVKCFTKNQPQNNKRPKSLHGFMTKKGSVPFVYRTMHKKQLIRSVRLLNSAGGVYFVIAAVPMSL